MGNEDEMELMDMKTKLKQRMIGNITFIGELYRKKMLSEGIIQQIIKGLLGTQVPDEEELEMICQLLSNVGEDLDRPPKSKTLMDVHYKNLTQLLPQVSSRCKFLLLNIIELRENNWQKTIGSKSSSSSASGNKKASSSVIAAGNKVGVGGGNVVGGPKSSTAAVGGLGGGFTASGKGRGYSISNSSSAMNIGDQQLGHVQILTNKKRPSTSSSSSSTTTSSSQGTTNSFSQLQGMESDSPIGLQKPLQKSNKTSKEMAASASLTTTVVGIANIAVGSTNVKSRNCDNRSGENGEVQEEGDEDEIGNAKSEIDPMVVGSEDVVAELSEKALYDLLCEGDYEDLQSHINTKSLQKLIEVSIEKDEGRQYLLAFLKHYRHEETIVAAMSLAVVKAIEMDIICDVPNFSKWLGEILAQLYHSEVLRLYYQQQ